MTEASHQMASNPLPPASRKPGAVGVAAGPGDRDHGRGRRAAAAPARPARSSSAATTSSPATRTTRRPTPRRSRNGWFRTGDQGVLDADGYLTLTGRLKEIINRGGEKISPREVDEVLMDHPAVRAGRVLRACRTTSSARTSPRRWCCAKARTPPKSELRDVRRRAARGVQGAAQDRCSSTRSRRARPASCSASAWRRSWACEGARVTSAAAAPCIAPSGSRRKRRATRASPPPCRGRARRSSPAAGFADRRRWRRRRRASDATEPAKA